MNIETKKIEPDAIVPKYAHEGDAGADLYSYEECDIAPFERRLVRTGISIALPTGYAAFIQPRSGLSHKQGLTVVNTPGLIDSGYRGELLVSTINLDPNTPVHIAKGERIAQMVIVSVPSAVFIEKETLDDTERGQAGIGSTGL